MYIVANVQHEKCLAYSREKARGNLWSRLPDSVLSIYIPYVIAATSSVFDSSVFNDNVDSQTLGNIVVIA